MKSALPWILVALVAGAWVGSGFFGTASAPSNSPEPIAGTTDEPAGHAPGASGAQHVQEQLAEMQGALEALRAEVQALRDARTRAADDADAPTLAGPGATPASRRPRKIARRDAAFREREAQARERRKAEEAARKRGNAVRAQYKLWYDQVRSLADPGARERALAEMREAFDGTDEVRTLAALRLSRWLGGVEYDRSAFRAAILPHTKSEDPQIRRAALEGLAWVQPEASDLPLWLEAAKTADRNNAETTAEALVRVSGGVIRDETADAVLHLLRDGTKIKKAFVIRGLQAAKEWDASVEARLIEIVRGASAQDYDSAYYFHFITPRLAPKSDAVLQLMLDRIAEGKGELQTIASGFRTGLTGAQRDRAADALIGYAENAGTSYAVAGIAEALQYVARKQHVDRMRTLLGGDGVDARAKRAIERAIDAAQRRG